MRTAGSMPCFLQIQVIDIQAFFEVAADPGAPLWCKSRH
jgi:hypothetical protein